jgi:hypothetical protein
LKSKNTSGKDAKAKKKITNQNTNEKVQVIWQSYVQIFVPF